MSEAVAETGAYQREGDLWVVPRREFAEDRFDYQPGQHAAFLGPTQRGKTELAFTLLEHTATPDMPAYVIVSKPTDKATSKWSKRLGYRAIGQFPPVPRLRDYYNDQKPSGYVVWPDMSDPGSATANATGVSRQVINGIYTHAATRKERRYPAILVLDDTVAKSKVLKLDNEMVMVLTMSGAMGVGGWFFVQKPTDAGKAAIWSYSQSEHIFITKDPDKRNRVRYGEIGGFDPKTIDSVSQSLKPYQFLYLERTHGYMCIVDSK